MKLDECVCYLFLWSGLNGQIEPQINIHIVLRSNSDQVNIFSVLICSFCLEITIALWLLDAPFLTLLCLGSCLNWDYLFTPLRFIRLELGSACNQEEIWYKWKKNHQKNLTAVFRWNKLLKCHCFLCWSVMLTWLVWNFIRMMLLKLGKGVENRLLRARTWLNMLKWEHAEVGSWTDMVKCRTWCNVFTVCVYVILCTLYVKQMYCHSFIPCTCCIGLFKTIIYILLTVLIWWLDLLIISTLI